MAENNIVVKNYEANNILLTSDLELKIRRFLTKQMIRILLLLLNCDMTNKEMAESMKLSSNALSNILQRMKKCEVPLLETERRDKYLLYSLTPFAREYTEKFFTVKGADDFKIVRIHEDETVEFINCQNALEKLKEKLGEKWKEEFPLCCFFYYENNERGSIPEADLFFETLEILIIEEQFLQVECIVNKLGDESSEKICMRYINRYIYIRRLCMLDNDENWETAYRFVDDIFSQEQMYISCDFLKNSGDLSKEDIVNMASGLMEIVDNSGKRKLTRGEFLDVWSKYFRHHERLIYYVAEKYRNKYSAV